MKPEAGGPGSTAIPARSSAGSPLFSQQCVTTQSRSRPRRWAAQHRPSTQLPRQERRPDQLRQQDRLKHKPASIRWPFLGFEAIFIKTEGRAVKSAVDLTG